MFFGVDVRHDSQNNACVTLIPGETLENAEIFRRVGDALGEIKLAGGTDRWRVENFQLVSGPGGQRVGTGEPANIAKMSFFAIAKHGIVCICCFFLLN